jgi:hypothetical protein
MPSLVSGNGIREEDEHRHAFSIPSPRSRSSILLSLSSMRVGPGNSLCIRDRESAWRCSNSEVSASFRCPRFFLKISSARRFIRHQCSSSAPSWPSDRRPGALGEPTTTCKMLWPCQTSNFGKTRRKIRQSCVCETRVPASDSTISTSQSWQKAHRENRCQSSFGRIRPKRRG